MQRKIAGMVCFLAAAMMPGLVTADEESKPQESRLEEIVVTGTKTPHKLKDAPVETVLINREDIERSNAQTVSDIIKTVPGINSSGIDDVFDGASSRVRMQGLSFNDGYGLILIDGQRVHGAGQSGAHGEYAQGLNQIPLSMVERIEIVKGPSSVLYGSDAVAGVINVITRKTPSETVAGAAVSYGWYELHEQERSGVVTTPSDYGSSRIMKEYNAYIGGNPYEKLSYLLNYSHEDSEGMSTDPTDAVRDSIMLKADYAFTDDFKVWLKGDASRYDREGTSPTIEDSYRISAGANLQLTDQQSLQIKGYDFVNDFDRTSSYSGSTINGEISYTQIEAQHSWQINKNNNLTTGIELQRQGIDYVINNGSNGSVTTVTEDVDTLSLFIQDEMVFLDDITIVPGIRYDDHSTFGDSFNPKLNVMYKPFTDTTFRASVGKAFKSPTIRQLYYDVPFYHSPFWIQSNPDLDPETSIGYTLGVEQWLFENRVILNLGFFRNDIEDMVISETADYTYEGDELRVYRNVEEAMTQGIEASARIMLDNNLSISAGYTFTDSENKESGNELTYSPSHQLNATANYEYQPLGIGGMLTACYSSQQYADTSNTIEVDDHVVVDGNIFKRISNIGTLTFSVDNIFDSDKGSKRYMRSGRTFMLKLNFDI